jgi:two-component system, NtrC family, sensor kinase
MKTKTLKSKILLSFFTIILVLGVSIGVLGYYVIKNDIIAREQKQVKNDLTVARLVYDNELDIMKKSFSVIRFITNIAELKNRLGLDYLYITKPGEQNSIRSEIARIAASGRSAGGTRLINKDELRSMGMDLYQKSEIEIKYTPKARPTAKKVLDSALAIEYARPLFDGQGRVEKVIYGGKIINRDFGLVDKIRDNVFDNRLFNAKPVGTVTIFLDDTRIATNVLNYEGQRAIGTRVSQDVYANVVEKGSPWVDRAFVVTDWYLTAYEPIKNISGQIIGILYVGIQEKPFNEMRRNILLVFLTILGSGIVLATILAVILDLSINKPLAQLIAGASQLASGDLSHRVKSETQITEFNALAESFNAMAHKLQERDKSLQETNEKLAVLNKSYLELVGFVSHELKGLLGSIMMNVYSLKEGFLGALSDKQQKAVSSTARSLDHFETMVKNYLDLSRIEKGELEVRPSDTDLNEDIIKPALAHFEKQIQERQLQLAVNVADNIRLSADKNLLIIVCDNLLGNAVKYTQPGGQIAISAQVSGTEVKVCFYNSCAPIKEEQKNLLFQKFSRLPGAEKIKGTGIGLFITRQIVEKHGGKIWMEPQAQGNDFIFTLGIRRETTS